LVIELILGEIEKQNQLTTKRGNRLKEAMEAE